MIKIQVYLKQNRFKKIKITGHADFEKKEQAIACAGVTAIVTGMGNAIEQILQKKQNQVKILIKEGYSEFIISFDAEHQKTTQILLQILYFQLLTIAQQYPKHINLIKLLN